MLNINARVIILMRMQVFRMSLELPKSINSFMPVFLRQIKALRELRRTFLFIKLKRSALDVRRSSVKLTVLSYCN